MALAAPANAQFGAGLGTIEGTVVDSQAKPVADASVTIQTTDGQHPHATRTDEKGHFEFISLTRRLFDFKANLKGN